MNIEDDPFAAPADTKVDEEASAKEQASSSEPEAPAKEPAESSNEAPASTKETQNVVEPTAAPDDLVIDTHADEPLSDKPVSDDVVDAAPPRLHQSLVDQLGLRWHEVKEFVSRLDGQTGNHELDDVLACARYYLKA